jgi:alpha-mannosidase
MSLRLYLDKLHTAGVADAPTFDQAWLLYRQQVFHAFVFWVFTIGQGAMQPDDFNMLNIERFANAMVDLESLAA